jgi:hypothetical protein
LQALQALRASDIPIPSSYTAALQSDHAHEWLEAMSEELNAHKYMKTWELVEPPPDKRIIGSRFVYVAKPDSNGILNRYKARLVAQGHTQQHGIDYHETFAPVTKLETIRTMCALAAHRQLHLHQMDVKTAFLNGDIEEEVYMRQPNGYAVPGTEHLVCKLKRSIYGLKQSPRAWYQKLDAFLLSIGMKRSLTDPSLYTRIISREYLAVAVYVDDLVIAADNLATLNKFKSQMSNRFDMKDLGALRHVLGIRVTHDPITNSITLDQESYIDDLLDRFDMKRCNTVTTPMDPSAVLTNEQSPQTPEEEKDMAGKPYRQLIGSLMYAMRGTRPDIAYAIGKLSKFCNNPGPEHWTAAKRVLRYLKGTKHYGIKYTGTSGYPTLEGYADADWAGNKENSKSTSGYVFLLAGGAISWRSRLQTLVALSSTEAEYVALAEAGQETQWLRQMLEDLNFPQTEPTRMWQDNQGCIALVKGQGSSRTKHINIKYHYAQMLSRLYRNAPQNKCWRILSPNL